MSRLSLGTMLKIMTEGQELKPLKNGGGKGRNISKSGRARISLKIPSSIKAIGKLAKVIRIKYFRFLEINQRPATNEEHLVF